ncbi:hypothetical protein GCK32_002192 [Trichostrongylus colubriformis]|uniref:Domain of unknown function DB domain-containing protein n=1 Tax=Trichostrongylus colubriformis TaxID=6319 RepID=A0AAN8IR62_TRICO
MCMAPPCIGGRCLSARARAARTYKDEAGVEHSVTTQEPDEHFSTCCSLLDVPESCRHMCTFEGYNTSARPDRNNEMAFSHLQCLDRFDNMKDCFMEHAITEYYRGKQSALDSIDKSDQL